MRGRQAPVEALYPHDRGVHCPACYVCGWCGREYHGGLCPCNSRDPLLAESVPNQQFGRVDCDPSQGSSHSSGGVS